MPNPLPSKLSANAADSIPKTDHEEFISAVRNQKPYEMPLRPTNHLGLHLGQHWTIVGATGSGKTTFALALMEYLRRQYPTIKRYVLDSTDDENMDEVYAPLYVYGNDVPDPLSSPEHTQVWKPDYDDRDMYNDWMLRILYKREPAIVFLDETESLIKNGETVPGHIKLLKQGRKHGVTVINLTQEITKVPTTMFRQMKHYAQFTIGEDVAEQTAARRFLHVTKEQQRNPLDDHGFFYRKTSIQSPTMEYRGYNEFFKSSISGGKQGVK